jgi:hypothetical protein
MKEWEWFSQSHVFSKILKWLSQSDARICQFSAGCVEWQSGLQHTICLEPKNICYLSKLYT